MPESLRSYLDFAIETAYLAGRLTLGYFQTDIRPDFKADDSPVTIADKRAEELIRARIEKQFPQHAIVGEEFGLKETVGATHRWIIDPIDGTKAFSRGVPLYGVLLGLEIEGKVQVGVAYAPAMNDLVAAATGEGCWWNGRRAHVSNVATLSRATIAHTNQPALPNIIAPPNGNVCNAPRITSPDGAICTDTSSSPPDAPNSCSIQL